MKITIWGADEEITVASYPLLPPGTGATASPVWIITAASPAGATIPATAQAVIAINTTWTLWAPTTAPPGGQQTATLVQDASQRWWRLIPAEGGTSPNPFLTDATAWDDSMSWDDTMQWSA